MEQSKDLLGDRMKGYEAPQTSPVASKGLPLVVRLDGKAFHSFTKGIAKPYDRRLLDLMVATTKHLVDHYHARVGYVQSDEISLVWHVDVDSKAEYLFGGRFQKLQSLLAAAASTYFNSRLAEFLPEKAGLLPIFDCRAFQVPDLLEAYHVLLWRQLDCRRNAVSMAAHTFFSHKSLQKMNTPTMIDRMKAELGIEFTDYADDFRLGTFVRRIPEQRLLSQDELSSIPAVHRPTGPVTRTDTKLEVVELLKLSNPIEYLFKAQKPEGKTE